VDLDNDTYYDGVNLTRTKKAALINISYGLSNFKQERFQKAIDLQSLDVQQLQVDDINGDGVLDLLVLDKDSSSGAARIRFFVGNAGSRIFTETGSVLVPQLSNLENLRLYSADLNGDSKVDLLFADDLSQSLYLLNQISFAASPVFEDAIQISVSGSLSIDIRSIECRDLNADGKPDVILKDKSSSSSKVFYLLGQ